MTANSESKLRQFHKLKQHQKSVGLRGSGLGFWVQGVGLWGSRPHGSGCWAATDGASVTFARPFGIDESCV